MKYKDKNVIWESRSKHIRLAIVCFLFVAMAFVIGAQKSPFMFWLTIAFFGGGGVFMLVRLLHPGNIFVLPHSELAREIQREQFTSTQTDKGPFIFSESGFTYNIGKANEYDNWDAIEAIFGYKLDKVTTDKICIDIFFENDRVLTLTESDSGWNQFNTHLKEQFKEIPPSWDINITTPAFETRLTLLYDKQGRTPEEAEARFYNNAK